MDWRGSGTQLVARILMRRRIKCRRSRTHTLGYCRACGVHQ